MKDAGAFQKRIEVPAHARPGHRRGHPRRPGRAPSSSWRRYGASRPSPKGAWWAWSRSISGGSSSCAGSDRRTYTTIQQGPPRASHSRQRRRRSPASLSGCGACGAGRTSGVWPAGSAAAGASLGVMYTAIPGRPTAPSRRAPTGGHRRSSARGAGAAPAGAAAHDTLSPWTNRWWRWWAGTPRLAGARRDAAGRRNRPARSRGDATGGLGRARARVLGRCQR